MTAFQTVVNGYAAMWDSCVINLDDSQEVSRAVNKAMSLKPVLVAASQASGPPWWWIAASMYREADLNLACYAGNGQSLGMVTTIVPIGRGPFATFAAGCVDAYGLQKVDGLPLSAQRDWTIEFALFAAEELNGEGYTAHKENSPYVWAGTNHEQPGLYTSDHGYDPTARDNRLGVAAVIKGLVAADPTIVLERSPRRQTMPVGPAAGVGAVVPAVVTNKVVIAVPNGPNIIIDLEHGVEELLNVLPTIAMFVPQLQVVMPFVPLIKAGLATAEATQAAATTTGGDPFTVFADHLHDFADQLAVMFAKK